MLVAGSEENFKYFIALVLKLLMKSIDDLFVRLFVITLLTFSYFPPIISLFGAGAAPFLRLRLRLRLRANCFGGSGSGSGSASLPSNDDTPNCLRSKLPELLSISKWINFYETPCRTLSPPDSASINATRTTET